MAISPNPSRVPGPLRSRLASSLLSRLALVVAAPFLFVCAAESVLRLIGFGKPTELFIPDDEPGYYRTNPNFTAPFVPASFGIQPLNFRIQKHKEPNHIRVFVLGESAAQGIPDPDFGFVAQLREQLKARFPEKAFEVFNLGITAINSHVVYRAARQVAGFEPDLVVIYMGNNEVVGPYGPGCTYLSAMPPIWLIRLSVWVRSNRIGQLLMETWAKLSPSWERSPEWKGMETFAERSVRGDDTRLEIAYRNYSANLQDIIDLAAKTGCKAVLATLVANLKDNAPFVSLHRIGLSAVDAKSWKASSDAGTIASDLGDMGSAMSAFEDAVRIDPEYAETQFRLGQLAEALGQTAAAREAYFNALHWDALRFRPDGRLNEIIRSVARRSADSVILVDAARAMGFDPHSGGPLPGQDILLDHVHFNWTGNSQMAQLLADGCTEALFGRDAHTRGGLDANGCAAALGYTPEAKLKMLRVIVQLTLRPPFTNQLTFSKNQARLKREIELTSTLLSSPGAKSAGIAAVDRARQHDPQNASLAVRLAAMEADAGDPKRALSLLERAESLEPMTAELSVQKARVLMQLQRLDEAEALLLSSRGMDEEYFSPGSTLVELWTRARQFDKGRRFFAQALARSPANHYLRLEYANLLAQSGDPDGAELQARRIWDEDPNSRPAMAALEMLVHQFERQGRTEAADALVLEARPHQPNDYYNNERLVRIYSKRDDPAKVAESLEALEASGPFDAAQHVDLAHRLADLNRGLEMLNELAQAREIARIEGNESQIQAINGLIEIYRRRFGNGQNR